MKSVQEPGKRGPKPNPKTRENLIRSGMQLLHETGYSATGVKDIVDAARVPKGSFYNHFESKETFGAEVVDFYFDSGVESLRALLTNSKFEPIERLKSFFKFKIRAYKEAGYVRGCMLGNLSLEVGDRSPLIRERLAAHFRTWSGLFADCIAEAQESGAIRNQLPASQLAQFVMESWEGALLRMRVEKSDAPLKRFTEVIFGALLI